MVKIALGWSLVMGFGIRMHSHGDEVCSDLVKVTRFIPFSRQIYGFLDLAN